VLMLYYTPTPEAAYRSIKDLQFAIPFGSVFRNLHRWAGHAMVAVVVLHLCRVFFTGAYKAPRQFNWVIGVALLVLTLALSFTGYLLPWDQLAFWAVTVGTSMATYAPGVGEPLRQLLLGGETVGAAALLRFYVLHCAILPVAMVLLIALHLFRVRRDGLSAPAAVLEATPQAREHAGHEARLVPAWPHLLHREVLLLAGTLLALQVFAVAFEAPLEEIADAARTPNPAKAPWYFLGLQEAVHYSALVGGVLAPAAILAVLLALPYLDTSQHGIGKWFDRSRRTANTLFAGLVLLVVALTVIGAWFRGPHWAWTWPWHP
jgi:quinol-cytochrome oxidoreductase complex cytochrome b subunit